MKPHGNVITLGLKDIGRARRFYAERLGWPIRVEDDNGVVFTFGDGSVLALYPWEELAADAGVRAEGIGFRGVTMAYVVRSEDRVDAVLAEAEQAGGTIVKPTLWDGCSGYFADPDGYLWEVVKAEELPSAEDS